MENLMRLRQICLIASELEPTLEKLSGLLGAAVCFRDPEVAHFGLKNALFEFGGDFLEVVSPFRSESAGARFLQRQGDGGYMILLQCADGQAVREAITGQGVRSVWAVNGARGYEDVIATHFHPRDVGGAILSIDSMGEEDWRRARSRWVWGGDDWQDKPAPENGLGAFAAIEMSAHDPAELAARWSRLLDLPSTSAADGAIEISLAGAAMRFVSSQGSRPDGPSAIKFHSSDEARAAFYQRAEAQGLPVTESGARLAGIDFQA